MIEIYDTTLRDGTQAEDISLSCNDKLRIAQKLDEFGVAYIEGGWPGSNPKDAAFFQRAKKVAWKQAKLAAFGSTCRAQITPAEDANLRALLEAETPVCTIFGKSWTLHVTEVLRTTLENNLWLIESSLAYLRQHGRQVIYDAEHFFDGYKADPAYALQTLQAAVRGGAERIVLADTNGGCMPWEISQAVQAARQVVGEVPLGIHAHNDSGCAVANSLAAIQAGCTHVQGTINGYGERCGNANLCVIIPNLELKLGLKCLPEGSLERLFDLAHFVAEVANVSPDEHAPYVGKSAFAHKGGVHVSAMRRSEKAYQHTDPSLVGNQMRVVVSELSGRGNLVSKAEEYGLGAHNAEGIADVLQTIKQLEAEGFSFEAAEASVALMLKRQQPGYQAPFELIDFMVVVENRQKRGMLAEATIKVQVNGEILHTAAEGNGPVNALDSALRKALASRYPQIHQFQLSDYKVRILDGANGTAATTRVLIDTQNGSHNWTTVGASTNIIEASWLALADAIEYGLCMTK